MRRRAAVAADPDAVGHRPGAQLQQHGIGVVHDLPGVGANLHDHVDVVQVVDAPQLTDLFGLSFTGAVNAIKGIFEWRRRAAAC